jgi:hypothetical protein
MRQHWLKFGAAVMLGLPAVLPAQTFYLRPIANQPELPSGVTINGISVYGGAYSLGLPASSTGQSPVGTMAVSGISANVGWRVTGGATQAFVNYTLGYNWNSQFSQLNGFDNALAFGLQRTLSPRVTLVLDAAGESSTYAEFLFDPSSSLSVAQTTPADQLGSALTGSTVGTGITSSPLSLILYGLRRREVSGGAKLVFAKSTRLRWTVSSRFIRDLPATGGGAVLPGGLEYGGVTQAVGALGFTYSLSRRTDVDGTLSYSRLYWMGSRVQIAAGDVGIGHQFSRRWFARVGAGYGELFWSLPSPYQSRQGAISAEGSLGARLKDHTVVISAARSIASSYGLGAATTTGGQIAWAWRRPGGPWMLSSSAGYERLAGQSSAIIQGWMFMATVTRRLTLRTALTAEAVYATDMGSTAGSLDILKRRGARLTFTWTPRPPAR